MSEQEKIDLLLSIMESKTSKNWTPSTKQKIFKQFKTDKNFIKRLKKAFVTLQINEVILDPLEDKVFDENGELLASRDWNCNAKNCFYKFARGNAP
jgi:hypothetical protein